MNTVIQRILSVTTSALCPHHKQSPSDVLAKHIYCNRLHMHIYNIVSSVRVRWVLDTCKFHSIPSYKHSPHFWHSPHSSVLCCVHTVNNHHQHQNMLNISGHYSVIISCYNIACKFHRYNFRCIEVFTSRLDYLVSVTSTIFYCLLSNFTS